MIRLTTNSLVVTCDQRRNGRGCRERMEFSRFDTAEQWAAGLHQAGWRRTIYQNAIRRCPIMHYCPACPVPAGEIIIPFRAQADPQQEDRFS